MSLAEECVKSLKEKGLTIATAESCTGGLLASAFISVPGSSECFKEGCVTYSNESKISRLGVSSETIEKYTAVSTETAIEMAKGIKRNLNADIGISTTGYAGPGGGDSMNPVGTVYVGISFKEKNFCYRLLLNGSRNQIREQAAEQAMEFLMEQLSMNTKNSFEQSAAYEY